LSQKRIIVILTQTVDPHVEPIVEVLHHHDARVVRFDLQDFPTNIQLVTKIAPEYSWQGSLLYNGQAIALEDIQSVWCRRPKQYQASPEEYTPPERAFLNLENYRGFLGVLQDMSLLGIGPFWVSRRDKIQAAEFKPAQLRAAQTLGLRVPRTLITNKPGAVRDFYEECQGQIIAKAVAKGVLDPDGQYMAGQERFIFTNAVAPEDLEDLAGVSACAHLFQERIAKAMDLRVVVIGRQIFTIGIHAHSEQAALDWRRSYGDLSYSVETLPDEIEQKLLQLVRLFGLQYSSMDLILSPEGEYVWLEANPNGQFLWMASPTGLPMAEAMANLLYCPEEYGLW
jgi:hypothetical protein